MFADIYSLMYDFLAVFLTGCVIKLLDDYLDQEYDLLNGKSTLAYRLGLGTSAYGILLFAIAVAFNWHLSVALFFAAYITGMVCDINRSFVSGLSGLQEIVIFGVLGCLLVSIKTIFTAIFVLLFIQVIDDWMDIGQDYKIGQRNMFNSFGVIETWCCGLVFLLSAIMIDMYISLLVIAATPLVIWAAKMTEREGMIR